MKFCLKIFLYVLFSVSYLCKMSSAAFRTVDFFIASIIMFHFLIGLEKCHSLATGEYWPHRRAFGVGWFSYQTRERTQKRQEKQNTHLYNNNNNKNNIDNIKNNNNNNNNNNNSNNNSSNNNNNNNNISNNNNNNNYINKSTTRIITRK